MTLLFCIFVRSTIYVLKMEVLGRALMAGYSKMDLIFMVDKQINNNQNLTLLRKGGKS
jgi:hypothetical protein